MSREEVKVVNFKCDGQYVKNAELRVCPNKTQIKGTESQIFEYLKKIGWKVVSVLPETHLCDKEHYRVTNTT